jgi:hypothetical protein
MAAGVLSAAGGDSSIRGSNRGIGPSKEPHEEN